MLPFGLLAARLMLLAQHGHDDVTSVQVGLWEDMLE